MTLLPLFEWIGLTDIGLTIRDSMWLFPIIECVHLLALAMLGGSLIVVDLRLLGLGLKRHPVSYLSKQAYPWLIGSLLLMLVTGLLLASSETLKIYFSPPFWWKMRFLGVAILFTFTVRRTALRLEDIQLEPFRGKAIAVVSLVLWFSVGFSGRWIAFY